VLLHHLATHVEAGRPLGHGCLDSVLLPGAAWYAAYQQMWLRSSKLMAEACPVQQQHM
jgi:hypothetical protein